MKRRPTMQDVADRAKVSKSAVSLAYNDPRKLSETTLGNIRAAAAELGYSQDPAARMLRRRRTDSLGLLLPQQLDRVLENPYYTLFMQGIGQVCQREGFTLLLAPPLRGSMLRAIPYAAVDGFIVCGLEFDRGEVTALQQRGVPFVLVDSEDHDGVSSVDIDDGAAMEEVVDYLVGLGHRRFTFVAFETDAEGGPACWRGAVRQRLDGAMRGLRKAGIDLSDDGIEVVEAPNTRAGGASAFRRAWGASPRPTAVVAFSDILAVGVLDGAREAGVSVPAQLSVSGFDDLIEAGWTRPALTTVRQPIVSKGRLAAEYLVEAIAASEGTSVDAHRRRLSAALLVRDSTGPAASA